ncbi:MAG: GNAT family N-acetyltransferase [Xanthobacteraceae bacterium]
MSSPVRNNTALSRFELDAEGIAAVAHYRLADGVITFTHTEVPPALRERGIASRLIQGALEAVRAQGLKVVPRCSFVRHYIATHAEFKDLLA